MEMIYILTLYFAARLLIGFSRWSLAADAAFITYICWALWGATPLTLLALPFYLGIAAVGGGVFRYYAGLASALSLSGVYLMFQQAPYLKAFGFVLAILSPAALLSTARAEGALRGFRYLVISAFASAFLFIGIGQRGRRWGTLSFSSPLRLSWAWRPCSSGFPTSTAAPTRRDSPYSPACLSSPPPLPSSL